MAITEIPWGDGSGDKIYLTSSASEGNQAVAVTSDANAGVARSKVVTFTSGVGNIQKTLTVNQEAASVNIPYIRNTDLNAYIDTGITPDNTTKVIVWARNFNPNSSGLFGSQIAVGEGAFLIGSYGETNVGKIRFDYATATSYAVNQFTKLSGYHKYELYQNILTVDNTVLASGTNLTLSSSYSIYLFGLNRGGNHIKPLLPMDICACKIFKGGVLVRDFVAVNDPVVGLYDAVSNTVFTPMVGTVTYGTFNRNAYIPLEYISCTNQQYCDIGVYGKGSMQVTCKFKILGTSIAYPNVFGTMQSGPTDAFLLQAANGSYPNRYMNFYISNLSTQQLYNNNSNKLTNKEIVFLKNPSNRTLRLIYNAAAFGTTRTLSSSYDSFVCSETIVIGSARNTGVISTGNAFNGYIYYAGFGTECNLVPALVNDIAGFYDTYNDVFHRSQSGVDFIAGPRI